MHYHQSRKFYFLMVLAIPALLGTAGICFRDKPPASAQAKDVYAEPVIDPLHPTERYSILLSGGETESDVLSQLPTTIYPEDHVAFLVDPRFGLGSVVDIERALPVAFQDGKKTIQTRTWAKTVGEVLDEARRPLVGLDKANYDLLEPISTDMTIDITRVSKVSITQTETIPFETTTKDDPNLDRPQTKVTETGKNGIRTKTYEITREDGEEMSRKLVSNEITQEPKLKVISKGTRIKIGKTTTGQATWYDLCCKKVASTTFKKGTVLRLTNLNTGKKIEVTVDDTGSFGPDTVVDLHPSLFQQLGGTLGQGKMTRILAEEILNPEK